MSNRLARTALAAVLCAFAVSLTAPVRAQEAAEKKTEKPKQKAYTGSIVSVDSKDNAVTLSKKVKDKEETMTFTCAADCKMMVAGKKDATLADLKVGDKITCHYTDEGGKMMCHKMETPAEKKEMEKKKE